VKVIYVAGKYTGGSEWNTYLNIHRAKVAARKLWGEGWVVICPHANTAFFGGPENHEIDRLRWLNGDIEILSRCDAIFMLRGFEQSRGAKRELEVAIERGLEVYYEGGN